jgi:hypothetical protein
MEISEESDAASAFGREMKRRVLEDFVISYYNGSVKPNLAEKEPMSGRNVEFLMDGPQFEKIIRSDIWSYSGATGTGYQYRVTYRDKRFSGLEQLVGMYSGSVPVAENDRPVVEQRLYEVLLVLIKEGRLPREFKLSPAKDVRFDKLNSTVERLAHALDNLEKRVKSLEEKQPQPNVPTSPPQTA